MPTLNYVSQSTTGVNVSYTGMPAGVAAVFHNEATGANTAAQSGAIGQGSGSAAITFPTLHAGQYRLRAEQSGQFVAETVKFRIG